MQIGLYAEPTDTAPAPTDVARAAEERGFESLWVSEHIHIPVAHRRRWKGRMSSQLFDSYWRMLEPFAVLSAAAAVTSRLKLGTGICIITAREPLLLAKQITTLDVLSGGRTLFAFGGGWTREELEMLGVPFKRRWQVAGERVAALKRLLEDDESEYHGDYVDFGLTLCHPKPIQQPRPPIYVGAAGHWARQRVIDWGVEGWLPNGTDPDRLRDEIHDLRTRAEQAGRDPDALSVTAWMGDPDALDRYERAGVDRVVLRPAAGAADAYLPELDRLARLLAGHT